MTTREPIAVEVLSPQRDTLGETPGLIATARNQWRRVDAAQWQAIEHIANPMGRAGTPEEMAAAALLLCSEAGSFITGADLQATGGAHL